MENLYEAFAFIDPSRPVRLFLSRKSCSRETCAVSLEADVGCLRPKFIFVVLPKVKKICDSRIYLVFEYSSKLLPGPSHSLSQGDNSGWLQPPVDLVSMVLTASGLLQ